MPDKAPFGVSSATNVPPARPLVGVPINAAAETAVHGKAMPAEVEGEGADRLRTMSGQSRGMTSTRAQPQPSGEHVHGVDRTARGAHDARLNNHDDGVIVWGAGDPRLVAGPGIGEGELGTTHMVIHHHELYGAPKKLTKWCITSIDTDQVLHILLAMAMGSISPVEVQVTVRRKKKAGASDYIYVNGVCDAVAGLPGWSDATDSTAWLTPDAKVALFIATCFLAGCDFLPFVHSMPFMTMWSFVVELVGEEGLFAKKIVYEVGMDIDQREEEEEEERSVDGHAQSVPRQWRLREHEGIVLLSACYYLLHEKLCVDTYDGPGDLMGKIKGKVRREREAAMADIASAAATAAAAKGEGGIATAAAEAVQAAEASIDDLKVEHAIVEGFVGQVRGVIWEVYGGRGKRNSPGCDAFGYHVKRACAMFEYWCGACLAREPVIDFRGKGWLAASGHAHDALTHANTVLQLSDHALMIGSRVKLLTCACAPVAGKNKWSACKCGIRGVECIPVYCKCEMMCRADIGDLRRAGDLLRRGDVGNVEILGAASGQSDRGAAAATGIGCEIVRRVVNAPPKCRYSFVVCTRVLLSCGRVLGFAIVAA